MKYKKLFSASFATLLLLNTGAPVAAQAKAKGSEEVIDENLLDSILGSEIDFETLREAAAIEKEDVEEEKQEKVAGINEQKLKEVEEQDSSDDSQSSEEESSIVKKESVVTEEQDLLIEEKQEEEISNNESAETTIVEENVQSNDARQTYVGQWGGCYWTYDTSKRVYNVFYDGGGNAMTGAEKGPWYQKNAPHTNNNTTGSYEIVIGDNVAFNDLSLNFEEYSTSYRLTSITFGKVNTSNVTDMSAMFSGCKKLEKVTGLENFDTSNVTSIRSMFIRCNSLKGVDGLEKWDTSNVTSMANMFYECSSVTYMPDLSRWDTSNVTTMTYMFYGCTSLATLFLSNWNLSNVLSASDMFAKMNIAVLEISNWKVATQQTLNEISASLKGISFYGNAYLFANNWDLSGSNIRSLENFLKGSSVADARVNGWKVPYVTRMDGMFDGCSYLKSVTLTDWDAPNVEWLAWMFRDCPGLKAVDLSSWNMLKMEDMQEMFKNCTALTTVDLSGCTFKPKAIFKDMFLGATSLTTLKVNDWKMPETNDQNFYSLTNGVRYNVLNPPITSIRTLEAKNWDISNVTKLEYLVTHTSLVDVKLSGWKISSVTDMNNMFWNLTNVRVLDVSDWDTSNVTTMEETFRGLEHLESLDLTSWDTSNVTNMKGMFSNSNIGKLDVENWNTSNVTNMYRMFAVSTVKELNLTNWNTSNVTNMGGTFFKTGIEILDLSTWDTTNVTTMTSMFGGESQLRDLNLSGWKITEDLISNMFELTNNLTTLKMNDWELPGKANVSFIKTGVLDKTPNLETLEAKNWDVSDVTDLGSLFSKRKNLQKIDLENWNTSNVTKIDSMFSGCSNLKELNVANWDTSKVKTAVSTFSRCESLENLDVTSWDMSSVNDMQAMFSDCSNLKELDLSTWGVSVSGGTVPLGISSFFRGCSSLESVDLSNWQIGKSISAGGMFYEASNVKTLKMNDLKLPGRTDLTFLYSSIFKYTTNLETLEAKNWEISDTTSLDSMYKDVFNSPNKITSLDLSGWKTPQVKKMANLFSGASSLEHLNLSGWNTKQVTNMNNLFDGASSLKSLDLSDWDTADAGMTEMFNNVSSLEKLTLGDNVRFHVSAGLNAPVSPKKESTGKWTREDGTSSAYAPVDFMKQFGTGDLVGGTYVAEVDIPYTLSNFQAPVTTIGKEATVSFDLDYQSLDTNLFNADEIMSFSVKAEKLPKEIDFEKVDVSYVSATGNLIPISAKRYDQENQTLHFDIQRNYALLVNKIRINLTGTAWNNTTEPENNTMFLVDFNADETEPIENSYLVRKIVGQSQVNNGMLSFSEVPEKLEFNPTKLIVTKEEMIIDRLIPNWGIKISDYRGTNALSQTDTTVARQNWELLATMDAFEDKKGESISPSALGLVYIDEDGKKEELSNEAQVALNKHSVENETAKDNHETTVTWKEEAGLKTVVKNRNALNSNEEYSARVNYELRVAP